MINIQQLEKILGYKITKQSLYIEALTHASYGNDNNTSNYERLEYVGDSLLNFFVAEYLTTHHNDSVGFLSKLRASLVSTDNLVGIAKTIGLENMILFSKSMKNNRTRHKVFADIIESLIAAIYYDKGLDTAKQFVLQYIIQNEDNVKQHASMCVDYKTILQETLQKDITNPKIEYICVEQKGTSDQPEFLIKLCIQNEQQECAWGNSKKQAEQQCAKQYLEKYNSEGRIEL